MKMQLSNMKMPVKTDFRQDAEYKSLNDDLGLRNGRLKRYVI